MNITARTSMRSRALRAGLGAITLAAASVGTAAVEKFESDPGFSALARTNGSVACQVAWSPADEDLSLTLGGTGGMGTQVCALAGGDLPSTTPQDAFAIGFDYMVPALPAVGAFGGKAASFALAPADFDPLTTTRGHALLFEPLLSGSSLRLRVITSTESTGGFGAPQVPAQVVDTGALLQAGVWYRVQVKYDPDASTLDLRVFERDSGTILADGVAEDFVMQSSFERYFMVAQGNAADLSSEARIDNVELGGDTLGVVVDAMPMLRDQCLPADYKGPVHALVQGAADFDVRTVDTSTLKLGELAVAERRRRGGDACRVMDTNRDGIDDLLCRFRDREGTLAASGGGSLLLTGLLEDGTAIEGADAFCVAEPREREGRRGKGHGGGHGWGGKDHDDDHDDDDDDHGKKGGFRFGGHH